MTRWRWERAVWPVIFGAVLTLGSVLTYNWATEPTYEVRCPIGYRFLFAVAHGDMRLTHPVCVHEDVVVNGWMEAKP